MGKRLEEEREGKVRTLVAKARDLTEREGLTPDEVREGLRRYIRIHFGGSINTLSSLTDEAMEKYFYLRELETQQKLV